MRKNFRKAVMWILLGTTFMQTNAYAIESCYLASDSTDELILLVDRTDGTTAEVVGPFGVAFIEAMARDPVTGVTFAANANQLGTISTDTGAFTATANTFGVALAANGDLPANVTLTDVDSIAFDLSTGLLYGVQNRGGDDILFQINDTTGALVPGAFGGDDYLLVSGIGSVDDIAIDFSGVLFASGAANLYSIPFAGASGTVAATLVGPFGAGITDMEGLSTDLPGNIVGSTGPGNANGSVNNSVWTINTATGAATNQVPISIGGDYEGFTCFLDEVDIELEKNVALSNDADGTGTITPGDEVTYTITVTNTDLNLIAAGIEVTDNINSLTGVSFVSFTTNRPNPGPPFPNPEYDSATGLWTVGSIPANSSFDLNIVYSIDAGVAPGTTIINTAEVTQSANPDPDSDENNDDGDQSEDDEDNAEFVVNSITGPVTCPAGTNLVNLATPRNATTATSSGNVTGTITNATGAILPIGTNVAGSGEPRLISGAATVTMGFPDIVPLNATIMVSLAQDNGAGVVDVQDSTDNTVFSAPLSFTGSNPTDDQVEHLSYSVASTNGAQFVRVTRTGGGFRVDGVEYSQICEVPIIAPTITKSFATDPIITGGTSTLTITLGNANAGDATLSAALVDTLPTAGNGDVIVATPANVGGTCNNADISATAAGTTISYANGATIPSGGCTITVDVTSNTAGTYTNTIPVDALQTDLGNNPVAASDDLNVNAPVPFCPAGSTLTSQVGNAVLATETGNVAFQGEAAGAIEALGTNASTANSALLRDINDELILDLGEIVPTNSVVTISIARQQNAASVLIEDSENGVAYSGGQIFNAGPNAALQRINYVVTAAAGARFIRFTNQNNSNLWVDGVEYSQICDIPPPPLSCPIGSTLTPDVGNAVLATETGDVVNAGLATAAIEAVGTTATAANAARLRTANDELILDLGEVVPTNGVVSISIARFQSNAIVLIEDSEDGAVYSGGQMFGNGPNNALQRIDYVVTAAAGARFIRFTNQNVQDIWVDGVEYNQICDIPPEPPVCPAGSTLTAQVGNAVGATETGAVLTQAQAIGAIDVLGTNASAANSARLRNANDELILDLGEIVPTNGLVTISIARFNINAIVAIEDSEDGVTYSGGQFFGNGPNTALQRIDYIVTTAAGAQFIRFTLQDVNDMWVDGVEYSEICDVPEVADLTITKDDSSLTYTPGGTATYVLTITNNGPDDVTGATIADNLPNGVTLSALWTCAATAGSSCSAASGGAAGGSAVNLTADILNGGTITVTVPVSFSTDMSDY